jgi:hypothetical protein
MQADLIALKGGLEVSAIGLFTAFCHDLAKPPTRVQRIERVVNGIAGIGDVFGGDFARSGRAVKGGTILEKADARNQL